MDNEILDILKSMQNEQQNFIAKQEATLDFLRSEAENARRVREEAIVLQKQAMARVRRIGYLAAPAILMCVVLIIYLASKYRIF